MTAKGKQATTIDKYPTKTVQYDCGCKVAFKVSPPKSGDVVICTTHGPTHVAKKRRNRNGARGA